MTNVSDRCYIGPTTAISTFAPLLKPLSSNPHAVLLLLFQNAVPEIDLKTSIYDRAHENHALQESAMWQYLPFPEPRGAYERRWHPDVARYQGGTDMLRKFEVPFEQFVDEVGLKKKLLNEGFKMREAQEHSITRAWPKRMTPGGTGAEFITRLAKCCTGYERYVECVRLE